MAERSKQEESQHTEAPERPLPQGALEQIAAVFQGAPAGSSVHLHLDEDRQNVTVVLGGGPPLTLGDPRTTPWEEMESLLARRRAREASVRESPPEMDDAYLADVRRAVGRGAPTVLLGTSNRALEVNFRKMVDAELRSTSDPGAPRTPPGPLALSRRRRVSVWFLPIIAVLFGLSITILASYWQKQSSLANSIQISILAIAAFLLVIIGLFDRRQRTKTVDREVGEGRIHAGEGDSPKRPAETTAMMPKGKRD